MAHATPTPPASTHSLEAENQTLRVELKHLRTMKQALAVQQAKADKY